jgi:hypothetical protein
MEQDPTNVKQLRDILQELKKSFRSFGPASVSYDKAKEMYEINLIDQYANQRCVEELEKLLREGKTRPISMWWEDHDMLVQAAINRLTQ